MQETVFTIGHSTHSQEQFLGLLRRHGITAVCDVRSQPYSRMNPQFNREALEQLLLGNGIHTAFWARNSEREATIRVATKMGRRSMHGLRKRNCSGAGWNVCCAASERVFGSL